MIYRAFGKTGWQVSAVGMGTWNIGNQWGEVDEVAAWAAIRASFDPGVNLFDTAESYGIPDCPKKDWVAPFPASVIGCIS